MAASEREESAANAPPLVDPLAANDPDNPPDEAPPLPPPPGLRKKKRMEEKPEAFVQEDLGFSGGADGYSYPSLGLLDSTPNTAPKQSKDEIIKRSLILEKKLLDFGIEGRVTQALPGPVITVYEFEPAPGVKVSRIASLADDLAMSLRAMSVRVLAPIPGKSVVGIEVPNPSREMVFLKELLASAEFEKSESKLTMLLGKDVGGTPMMVDLATVPHLLIAGSTGSGKSVGINAMICSILYKATPAEVKFIMIDPKMLELSIYEGIPHLITPVVTNPKKAANALRWAVAEMERRYERLSELGVRNIDGYNRYVDREKAKAANQGGEGAQQKAPPEKLPYIVVIIDELADLMMVASKDVEDALARLAQMARAAGVHLIVATQRPSVDVLTGLIKANFPARISYQVRTRVDSRTILDSMGADTLLGKGDMLLLPPGVTKLMRIHGPFVSDEEIHRVVDFLKQQQKPVYDTQILEAPAGTGEDAGADLPDADMDDNYDKAVELVAQTRQASISMIQRRLRIGYNRAARIVEMMEKQGLVGPADGLKPREVFIKELDDVESVN
jgi:S-DNA-T family DNA segregation ATPase FtsK/SpoIIIE